MDPIERAAKIREALYVRGLTFADIDRAHGLSSGAARATLREPNAGGEAAVAAALDCEPHELWPERYDAAGQRLSPQPHAKHLRPPTRKQRRNDAQAST